MDDYSISSSNNNYYINLNFTFFNLTDTDIQSFIDNTNDIVASSSSTESTVHTVIKQILIGILLYSLTIWTIIGNIMVWIALCTNKQLKQGGMSNYLIGNLALSDLLLGITVLPFSATVTTLNHWIFGKYLCDIWLSIDVLCCTASIWGLLVIAIDRYIATNHPLVYRKQKNSVKTAIVYCTISWIVSLTISIPPFVHDLFSTINLNYNDNESKNLIRIQNSNNQYECVLFYKPSFVIASSLGSFYIPCILMLLLYAKVFLKIRQQTNLFKKHNYHLINNNTSNLTIKIKEKSSISSVQTPPPLPQQNTQVPPPSPSTTNDNTTETKQSFTDTSHSKGLVSHPKQARRKRYRRSLKQAHTPPAPPPISRTETRITKTLAIIIFSFILCWMPFFTTYIIRSQIDYQIPVLLMDVFIWLGYFNSALNPILYAILNSNFRQAFKDILACKCFF